MYKRVVECFQSKLWELTGAPVEAGSNAGSPRILSISVGLPLSLFYILVCRKEREMVPRFPKFCLCCSRRLEFGVLRPREWVLNHHSSI